MNKESTAEKVIDWLAYVALGYLSLWIILAILGVYNPPRPVHTDALVPCKIIVISEADVDTYSLPCKP